MHAQLFTHDPRLDGNAHGFWEWRYNNVYTIGHGGDTLLFHSLLVLIPEQNAGFFVSYNSIGGGGSPRTQLMESIMDRYFPMRELAEIRTVPDFKKRAKRLVGVYKLARVNSSSFEKLLELVMTVRVKASRNNTLIISSVGSEKKQWVETEPLVFREKDGQETVIFREDSKGRITHLFLGGVPEIACIKLAWYESPTSLLLLEAIAVILFLSTLVWPIRALSRVAWKRKHEEKCAPKVFRWIAGGMSAAYVLFIIGLLMVLGNYMALIFGVPPLLKAVLVLPIIGAVLTVVALILMVTVWMRKYWSVCGRVHYTLVVLASIVFILLLYYWNLLGFQF